MHDILIDLRPWTVVALSFVPVAIFATLGAVLSKKVHPENGSLMTSILRIAGGALVFVAAFTIANLWAQANKYLDEVTTEYAAGWELDSAVQTTAPPATATAVRTALRVYRQEVERTEIGLHVPPEGSPEARVAFADVEAQTAKAVAQASSPPVGASVEKALEDLADARSKRVDYPELAGLPGIIVITIMVLAWATALLLGLFPGTDQKWVKVVQTGATVLVLSMIQMAVLYLATRAGMIEIIQYALQLEAR
ncbi:MAG: hypothetical protein WCI74_03540 [Actinomycetes bacterium]